MPFIVIMALAWLITCFLYRTSVGTVCALRNIEPPWIRNKRENMALQDQKRARRYEAMRSRRTLRGFLGRLWGDLWEDFHEARDQARQRRRDRKNTPATPLPDVPHPGRWAWLTTAFAATRRAAVTVAGWLAERCRALMAWFRSMRGTPAPDSTAETWYYAVCRIQVSAPGERLRCCGRVYRYLLLFDQFGVYQSQTDCGHRHASSTRTPPNPQATPMTQPQLTARALPMLPAPPVLGATVTTQGE